MRINENMDLQQLAERMGEATRQEAAHMRSALVVIGAWDTTEEVEEKEWLKMLDAAVAQAKWDHLGGSN